MKSNKKQNKKKRKLNIWRLSILIMLLALFIIGGTGVGFLYGIIKNMPEFDLTYNPDLSAFIYDNNGEIVAQLRGQENRIFADFSEMPDSLKKAFLATEDIRFYDHFGVDLKAIARAVVANIKKGGYAQGSSTITMQLASNAFIGHREKKMERKIQEAILAIQLERIYTKDEIFNLYLNHINFGEGAWGVKTAAQVYFDKQLNELTLAESALLAGLVQRPSTYSPFRNPELATNRRNTVLSLMEKNEFISAKQVSKAKNEGFVLNENKLRLQENYPWFTDYVIKEASDILEDIGMDEKQIYTAGLSIYTTMDKGIQTKLEEIYNDPSNFPEGVDEVPVESAAVLLDHTTGEVKALVGGRELVARRSLNRATDMKRQPGSTIKPIAVYGPALELGFSPAYVLDDAPVQFPSTPQPYAPNNYDNRFRGLITMRAAIKDSVNIPAVKMLHKIGVDQGYDFAKKLGLPLSENDRNLSLALGGLTEGVAPLDMASAFGAFANQGVLAKPHVITKILDKDKQILYEANTNKSVVMSEQTAYLMTDMLVTVVQSGTGTRARLNRPTAGKTGTTQLPPLPQFANLRGNNFRDSWYAGYTPEYTAVVWMGYDETTPKHYLRGVFGGQLPALIWKQIMEYSLQDIPVKEFTKPPNLVYTAVDAKSGLTPSELTPKQYIINEIFVRNNVPKERSEVWVEAPVCAETGLKPTEYCPDVVNGVFLERLIPYEPPPSNPNRYPEDWELQYPAETCDLHGADSQVTVYLCEDPRHRGFAYLALLPEDGIKGGCPSEMITKRTMAANQIPDRYCTLPDHQYTSSKNNNSTDDNPAIVEKSEIQLNLQFIKGDNNNIAVLLNWTSLGTNINYSIQRWENGDRGKLLETTANTSFLDESIDSNKTYKYQISTDNSNSNIASITTK
jgi:penicillin-binding protein 1A